MKVEITFRNVVEAENLEKSYDDFLEYLGECVRNGDVTAFQFFTEPEPCPTCQGTRKVQEKPGMIFYICPTCK